MKIDSELLKRIEAFIKKNNIKYANKKQFIDIAVLEKLEREAGIFMRSNKKPEMLSELKEVKVPTGII